MCSDHPTIALGVGDAGRGVHGWFGVDVCEQLELHNSSCTVRFPAPHALAVRFELGVAKGSFESFRVHGASCDLEVDLHVNVRSPGVAAR